jgi:flagellar basal body-associated protein FliL
MHKSKKGVEGPIWILIIAIILLIFLVVYSGITTKLLGKETKVVSGKIEDAEKDSDNDGVPDIVDRCPGKNDIEEGC